MTNVLNDDYGKKFQLTDSLLKRLLNQEEYDRIKTIEPVIVVTDESSSKHLKNPGYKHAVVSSHFLYVVNTPAKHDTDLLLSVPLEDVVNVQLVYDTAAFLQGDLRENAQHIQLTCKQHPSTAEHLLLKATSLALLSTQNLKGENSEIYTRSLSLSGSQLPKDLSQDSIGKQEFSISRNCKSLNTSPDASFSKVINEKSQTGKKSKNKSRDSSTAVNSLLSTELSLSQSSNLSLLQQSSSRRPLPQPLSGTEELNASYTRSMLLEHLPSQNRKVKEVKKRHSLTLTPSKSIEGISEKAAPVKNNTIGSTYGYGKKQDFLVVSSSSALSQSWNDVLKIQHLKIKKPVDSVISTTSPSSSFNGSVSSKLFKFMKGSKENLTESESTDSTAADNNVESSVKILSSSSETLPKKQDYDEYVVDVFTVSKGSRLFNILEQSWMYSVIIGTLENSFDLSHQELSLVSQKKIENDAVILKFTELKEEIISSTQYDELFLLTKEMKHACHKYLVIKKYVWKSASFLKFYIKTLSSLVQSDLTNMTARMDELDVGILIGEFLVSVFQDSETFTGRNMLLNEKSGLFIKNMLDIILSNPKIKCLSKDKEKYADESNEELFDLIGTWSDVRVSILFEIINAAKQSLWCCTLERKSFDVTMLTRYLCSEDKRLKNIIDHIMFKLTTQFSSEWEYTPSPSTIVILYKCLFVLHFVCINCPSITCYVKTYYHEEVKYYISKEDNIKRIPTNYPVTCLITSFLPIVISTIT